MRKVIPIAFVLTLMLVGLAEAKHENQAWTEGTPVVIVGRISSPPKGEIKEQKMQVAVGKDKTDYTLHFGGAELMGLGGQKIDEDGLDDGQWVRAEGTVMDDARRIKASRLWVIGDKDLKGLKGTTYFRKGHNQGYVMQTAPANIQTGWAQDTPVVLVGQITSPPKGEINEQKMQVGIGPDKMDYTVHFKDAMLLDFYGNKIDEDGLDDGQWVRAEGKVMDDSRRIKATRVQVIAKDAPSLQRSAFWRSGYEQGYVMSVAGARQTFPEIKAGEPLFHNAPMMIVGRVSEDTGPVEATRKLRVEAAGNVWTLEVPKDATVLDEKGEKLSVHEVSKGQWIRAAGMQTDDLRIKVTRLENIGQEEAFKKSQLFRMEWPMGYVERGGATR